MDYVGEEWSSRRKGVDTSVGGGGEGWTSCNIKVTTTTKQMETDGS